MEGQEVSHMLRRLWQSLFGHHVDVRQIRDWSSVRVVIEATRPLTMEEEDDAKVAVRAWLHGIPPSAVLLPWGCRVTVYDVAKGV